MKFKIGDWVIDQYDKHLQLNNSHFYGVSSRTPNWFDNLKPWHPKEGEWCWLNNSSFKKQVSAKLHLIKYSYIFLPDFNQGILVLCIWALSKYQGAAS